MYQLGIISSDFIGNPIIKEDDFESNELYKSVKKFKIPTLFIDPTKIHIELLDDEIALFYAHEQKDGYRELINISSLKAILVRRTRGFAEQIYDVIALLKDHAPNTKIYDPAMCFNRPLSKISTFNLRFGLVNQPRSLIIPGDKAPKHFTIDFPVVAKPSHGWRGYGVKLCKNMADLEEYFATRNKSLGYAVILQERLQTQDEYRVFLINGKSIGAVVKVNNSEKFAKNAAQGSKFIKKDIKRLSEIIDVAEKCAQNEHLTFAGADLTIHNNQVYILECNRNPEFKSFSKAMNINVADKMVEFIVKDAQLISSTESSVDNIEDHVLPSDADKQQLEVFEKKLAKLKEFISKKEFSALKNDINALDEALKKDYIQGNNRRGVCGERTNNFLINMVATHPSLTYRTICKIAEKILEIL